MKKFVKKFLRKAKNVVLKTITTIAAFGLLYSICAMEISTWLPILGFLVSGGWLIAYCYANRERFGGEA